ncbi:MAG: sensor histidine kinase, partial [Candidatus Hydrothermarchaeaceae archaeon]
IGLNKAIPCGLIINELVSNSLKYAFSEEKRGVLQIKFLRSKGRAKLIVSDNGVGIPKGIDCKNTETFGLRLVNMLVEQIEGTIELNRGGGTKFTITFKKSMGNVRVKRPLSGLKGQGHAAFATPPLVEKAVKRVKAGESASSLQRKA